MRFLSIFLLSISFSQINYKFTPEITNYSFSFPVLMQTTFNDNFFIKHQSIFFHKNHNFNHFIWNNYNKNDLVYVSDISFIKYENSFFEFKFGRDYVNNGAGKIFGLNSSPQSPSLDQLVFNIKNFKNFSFINRVVRLDNRKLFANNQESIINRWYYFKKLNYQHNERIKFGFYEGVISTGIQRNLEWYYLNPLTSFIMEHKNEISRYDGQDSSYSIGKGDNDNHFIGLTADIYNDKFSYFFEIMIDEFQIDNSSKDNMQTVFGIMFGVHYISDKTSMLLEFAYASPWLYLNRGVYSSLEKHLQPIGLNSPFSQNIGASYKKIINDNVSINLTLRKQYISDQTLMSKWDAWNNKIDYFDFNKSLKPEVIIFIDYTKRNHSIKYGIKYNVVQSDMAYYFISKNINFSL